MRRVFSERCGEFVVSGICTFRFESCWRSL